MFESPVKKRDLILFSFFSLIVLLAVFLSSFFDERTKIVFCNVGQGDAAYIRIKNKIDVLIDAGPDKRVLSCLGKYMPFWDRKIELAFLSHPNNDHYNGYFFIADRYQIDKFITVNTSGLIVSKTYKKLLQKISGEKIKIEEAFAGKIIQAVQPRRLDEAKFNIVWPPKDFSSPNDNDYSSVFIFQENTFKVLFTGDSSPFVLGRLSHGAIGKVDVLKIPHHGSKNGLTKKFLDLADPAVAVISVGKNNSYGHPSKVILDMLKAKNVKVKRTDINGDIIFKITNDK
ncbi:MAG: ComE-like protein, Metallo beta-lactamase superfamily hydrolase [Candidatus Roizmanbacteria bacterium GW2011_GWC2_34_23]|uniref:ComE-like protein, Metallo beta-lactamase superfamily hydrolase n=1 Tax=Candidatus Roizmanbacteria bacterium GW2011_GWC2_34_23 TaxID=1618484 RepID=A0A0G0B0Q1_9BACT|nr:MAG: ComE-like protein, Metallo beta-lactamase superfamily hydrolase [Candidatus Roizmanbacteria bacterium GW2011_GWC2_34_23]